MAGFDPLNQAAGPAPPLEPKPEDRFVYIDTEFVLHLIKTAVNKQDVQWFS